MGLSVVVFESDSKVARSLSGGLSSHFHSVYMTRSGAELRERVARNRPAVVILDIEHSRLTDVRNLHDDFPSLPIVCTHRVPDEELWIAAMEAGASDVCRADNVQDVLTSALRNVAIAKTAVA
jgi:DNA-binding NarL/FixJ family response regulator